MQNGIPGRREEAGRTVVLGIDASNLRAGGGFNHLPQILEHLRPEAFGIERVVVWANRKMLGSLPTRSWLKVFSPPQLEKSLPHRIFFQQVLLPKLLKAESCDILFAPGGTAPFRAGVPTVVMSRNMLPFEESEYSRYKWPSLSRLRLELLRKSQVRSFRRSHGVIFLTQFARKTIQPLLGRSATRVAIVPHGVDPRFFQKPRVQRLLGEVSRENPFRFLYVSTVDLYKHQWVVAEAAKKVRDRGLSIHVEFVGSGFPEGMRLLNAALQKLDPAGAFLTYRSFVNFNELHSIYHDADAFLFASTCENLPNILLEAMASGLPIGYSNKPPMSEIIEGKGVPFNAVDSESIAEAMIQLIQNPELRQDLARRSFELAHQYSWERCAQETFAFVIETLLCSRVPDQTQFRTVRGLT